MPQEIQHTFPGVLAFGLDDDAGSRGAGAAPRGTSPGIGVVQARENEKAAGREPCGFVFCSGALHPDGLSSTSLACLGAA